MSVLWEIPKDDKNHIMKRRELVVKIHAMLAQLKLWVAAAKNASNVDVGLDIDLGDLDAQTPAGASTDPGEETDGETNGEMDEETDGEGDREGEEEEEEDEEEEEGDGELSEETDEEMQMGTYAERFGMRSEELSDGTNGSDGQNDEETDGE